MRKFPDRYWHVAVVLLTGLLSCLPPVAVPASDGYLRALEAEASDTGARSTAPAAPAHQAAPPAGTLQDRRTIRPGMDFGAFETELEEAYPGTWFLYEKLGAPQRKAVYGAYRKDGRTAAVRNEIVRQLSGH
jgi:hypothetical protein